MCSTSRTSPLLVIASLLMASLPSQASIVYDSSTGALLGLQSRDVPGLQLGDEITIGGTDRVVTEFVVQYGTAAGATGNETLRVRFLANDGPSGEPGSLLYDSGALALAPSPSLTTFTLGGLSVLVPDTITFTFEVAGVGDVFNDAVLLGLAGPPSIGSDDPDMHWNSPDGVTWAQLTEPASILTFNTQITAIPEPATSLLVGMGLLALAARVRHGNES